MLPIEVKESAFTSKTILTFESVISGLLLIILISTVLDLKRVVYL